MPFLGPLIALWITLAIAVMASYFLFVAPRSRTGSSSYAPPVRTSTRRPNPLPRWGPTATTEAPRPVLPVYEMEEYPTDQWGPSAA